MTVFGGSARRVKGHKFCVRCLMFKPASSFLDKLGYGQRRCWGCRQTKQDESQPPPTGILPTYEAPPPPPGPVAPDDVFDCIPFRAKLKYRSCLERRMKKWRVPSTGEKRFNHPFCAEQCAQGRQNADLVQITVAAPAMRPNLRAPRLDLVNATREELLAKIAGPAPAPPAVPETTMPDEAEKRKCADCKKPLRSNNTGDRCYKCKTPGRASWAGAEAAPVERPPRAAKAPRPRPSSDLPEPSALPDDYLARCIAEAIERPKREREAVETRMRPLEEQLARLQRSAA